MNTSYDFGGYGVAGTITTKQATLEIARTGDTLDFYANRQHFAEAPMTRLGGPEYLTIFLRPNSGDGHFDPTVGNPDAHTAVLDQLTIVANAFVLPEPSSVALMASAIAIGCVRRRRNCIRG